MKYIATRTLESYNGIEILVQAQSNRSYNWETKVAYPISQKAVAEIDACNKAKKYSKEVSGLVYAYNCGGYAMKGYINGEEYNN